MTFKELSNRLTSNPGNTTLRKYLNILVEMGLIKVETTSHHGVVKSKNFFEITLRGRDLISPPYQEF